MIEASGLNKRYGRCGPRRQPQLYRRARLGDRVPRSERLGQIHNDADDPGLGPPGHAARPRSAGWSTTISPGRCGRWARNSRPAHFIRPARRARICGCSRRRGIPDSRVVMRSSARSACPMRHAAVRASSRSACPSDWASPRPSSATPGVLILDEPVNGLDPWGVRWIRTLLRNLAAEGRTVLVSRPFTGSSGISTPGSPEANMPSRAGTPSECPQQRVPNRSAPAAG